MAIVNGIIAAVYLPNKDYDGITARAPALSARCVSLTSAIVHRIIEQSIPHTVRSLCLYLARCFMRILVVDDNRDILDLVQRVLLTYNYDVVIARDGLEALQQESTSQPDLVILDVNLPTLDGWEVCRRIKARRSVPVLLLTVRAERIDIERSQDAGADDHLPKPFDIAEFIDRIQKLMIQTTPQV